MSAAFALGAAAAQWRAARVAAPRLVAESGPVRLTGWVMEVEPGATRPRMRVLVQSVESLSKPPRFVRISVRADGVLPPGRAIDCLVLLRPPEGPMAPHAYDLARRAWFMQVGATGFALGRCRPVEAPPPPATTDGLLLRVSAMRRDLTEAIFAAAPNEGGALAAAMVTGDRSLMSEASLIAFRDSGLGHLLSVSGLHMALVAGGVYAMLHFLLALATPLALRFPIRKWAAGAALVSAAAYLVVSGASVPAQRAFVMTAVALGAVLLDRPPFSLRALGVAAVVVVLLAPESVVDAGFQMSFAATAALIAAFETRRGDDGPPTPGLLLGGIARTWRTVSDMLLISVVAGLATDPFAIYHFQRFATYGLAANLAATPIITFVAAPAAVAAAVLAPFGLAEPALALMAFGLDMVRGIGAAFAERPEAVRALPAAPTSAFLLAVGAIVWICLWRGALRWFGLVALAAAAATYLAAPRPVVWADGDLRAVVARTPGGWVSVGDPRRAAFARGRLGTLAGLSPMQADRLPPPDGCDRDACVWRSPAGRPVVRVFRVEGLARACLPHALVLSDVARPADFEGRCRPAMFVDPGDLAAHGGLSVAEPNGRLIVRRALEDAGRRPWSGALRRNGG
jgi:competence protein ComEC